MNVKQSTITERLMDSSLAEQVWLQLVHKVGNYSFPWAKDVEFGGQQFVVGMTCPDYYTVIPVPFEGHSDDWEVLKPIRNARDLMFYFDAPKMEELEKLLDVPIVFGLQAQGHIPIIEEMLTQAKTWEDIGNVIGWCPKTAEEHYERYAQSKLKPWPSKAVSLICCRVGDPYWKYSDDAVVRKCWNCDRSVMARPDTIRESLKENTKIICVHCAATYAKASGKKIQVARDGDQARKIIEEQQ